MRAEQETIDRLLGALASRLLAGKYNRHEHEFWARRAVEQYTHEGQHDRGIFSIYWFNLVHLRPGEGIFQAAGIPHAYLEGQCIELMADSDNVLRGGLTQKHIDVAELLANTSFCSVVPRILSPVRKTDGWYTYHTPVADFKLSYLNTKPERTYEVCAQGVEILLLFSGAATINNLQLKATQRVVLLEDGERVRISSDKATKIFRAGVGD